MESFEPFDAVVQSAVRLLDFSMARLRLLDSQQRLRVMGYAGRTVLGEDWKIIPLGDGFAGKIANGRQPVWLSDVSTDDMVKRIPWVQEEELMSVAAMPLIAGERRLGMMAMGSRKQRDFTADEQQAILAFGAIAAWKLSPHMAMVENGRFENPS